MKKHILIYLLIFTATFRLSAQLSDPEIEFNRTWAYQYEFLDILVRTVGSSNNEQFKTELTVIEGDIDIRGVKNGSGSSYSFITDESTIFVTQEFSIVPLKSERIVLKATVKDLHNNKTLESNTISFDLIPQPDHPEARPPHRYAANLNLRKTEIFQGEETPLLIEVFSDKWVTNMESLRLKDPSPEIKYMRDGKVKKIFFQGAYGRLFTLPLMIYSNTPGKYTIPSQELEVDVRDAETLEITTKTLRTNPVELTVKELPGYSDKAIIASKMEISISDYPEKILKDGKLYFRAELISDGCLDNVENLSDYFTRRIDLEETLVLRTKVYDGDKVLYKVIFDYTMVSKSLVGLKMPKVVIPYINTKTAEPAEFKYKFSVIEGNVSPILFWSFIFVILAIVAISSLGVWLYIKKSKTKKKKNLDKDIPINENNMANFHTFVDEFNLTQREKDILKILVEGKSTKDIAESLYISPETAKKHINNIMKKTETHSRYEIFVLLNKYVKTE